MASQKQQQDPVQLGFSVPYDDDEHRMVVGHKLPMWNDWDGGQIGGRPSWLNPRGIPQHFLTCNNCHEPLWFICQLYAPADDVTVTAFHRSIYLWGCPNMASPSSSCSKQPTGSIRVLRTQLPKDNLFYPPNTTTNNNNNDDDESLKDWSKHLPESWKVNLCQVCGQRSKGKCPIQGVHFCGKHHQKEYKKFIYDKRNNNNKGGNNDDEQSSSSFLPSVCTESELVVEEEPASSGTDNSNKQALFEKGNGDDDDDDEDADLEQEDLNKITGAITSEVAKDPTTIEFYARTRGIPNVQEQCLRYLRWPTKEAAIDANMPLWISTDNQPDNIPCCEKCGAERKFEFQIMPQMIHYLMQDHSKHRANNNNNKVDDSTETDEVVKEAIAKATSIMEQAPPEQVPPTFADAKEKAISDMRSKLMGGEDGDRDLSWGVIGVYTCTASCSVLDGEDETELGAYREEFAWKQPSLD